MDAYKLAEVLRNWCTPAASHEYQLLMLRLGVRGWYSFDLWDHE